jgi:hypothetical protein
MTEEQFKALCDLIDAESHARMKMLEYGHQPASQQHIITAFDQADAAKKKAKELLVTDLPEIKELTHIEVHRGEVLIVSVPKDTTPQQSSILSQYLRCLSLGGNTLIVPDDIKFFKISELAAEKLQSPPPEEISLTEMEEKVFGDGRPAHYDDSDDIPF